MAEPSSSSSGVNKRNRESEDEAYLDNFHSHKRYLSEIMASSLNGLTVGDSMSDNLIESPARSETIAYLRDDISMQYSPMSEDSDDARYSEINISMAPSESLPSSPSSPHRLHQRTFNGTTSNPYPCNLTGVACSQPRLQQQQRGSESEGRFPSSPSDICHSADLRRAALLRSVQMRVHPAAAAPPSDDIPFSESDIMEGEDHQACACACACACSCRKSVVADCACPPHLFGKECSSGKVVATPSSRMLHINEEETCQRHDDPLLSRRSQH